MIQHNEVSNSPLVPKTNVHPLSEGFREPGMNLAPVPCYGVVSSTIRIREMVFPRTETFILSPGFKPARIKGS